MRLPAIFLVIVSVSALAACGGSSGDSEETASPSASPESHVLSGTISISFPVRVLNDLGIDYANGCKHLSGFDDIPGAQVVVKDETAKLIAIGQVAPTSQSTHSVIHQTAPTSPGRQSGTDYYTCSFPFQASGVPKANIYSIEVSHRDGITYTYDQLVGAGWTVAMTLK